MNLKIKESILFWGFLAMAMAAVFSMRRILRYRQICTCSCNWYMPASFTLWKICKISLYKAWIRLRQSYTREIIQRIAPGHRITSWFIRGLDRSRRSGKCNTFQFTWWDIRIRSRALMSEPTSMSSKIFIGPRIAPLIYRSVRTRRSSGGWKPSITLTSTGASIRKQSHSWSNSSKKRKKSLMTKTNLYTPPLPKRSNQTIGLY